MSNPLRSAATVPLDWTGELDGVQVRRVPGEGPGGEDVIEMINALEPDNVLSLTTQMYDGMIAGVDEGIFDLPEGTED